MSIRPKDPLLTAGKVMTVIMMVLTATATVALIGAIPIVLFNQADFAAAVLERGGSSDHISTAMFGLVALLLLGAAVAATAFHFFQLLRRLIQTVGEGDPFSIENADRLSRMGWIALIFQIAAIPIAALAIYLGKILPYENLNLDFEFTLTGVLLAIVLFILARVFKHGAEMRDDLEGTV